MALWKPLFDRVIVQQFPSTEKVSDGGIVLVQTRVAMPRGEVLAVGDDVQHLRPGDHVMYGLYAGSKVLDEREDLLVLKEAEVLALDSTRRQAIEQAEDEEAARG